MNMSEVADVRYFDVDGYRVVGELPRGVDRHVCLGEPHLEAGDLLDRQVDVHVLESVRIISGTVHRLGCQIVNVLALLGLHGVVADVEEYENGFIVRRSGLHVLDDNCRPVLHPSAAGPPQLDPGQLPHLLAPVQLIRGDGPDLDLDIARDAACVGDICHKHHGLLTLLGRDLGFGFGNSEIDPVFCDRGIQHDRPSGPVRRVDVQGRPHPLACGGVVRHDDPDLRMQRHCLVDILPELGVAVEIMVPPVERDAELSRHICRYSIASHVDVDVVVGGSRLVTATDPARLRIGINAIDVHACLGHSQQE